MVAGALSAALAGLGLLGVAPRAQAATDLSVPFALGGQNTRVTGASGSSIVAGPDDWEAGTHRWSNDNGLTWQDSPVGRCWWSGEGLCVGVTEAGSRAAVLSFADGTVTTREAELGAWDALSPTVAVNVDEDADEPIVTATDLVTGATTPLSVDLGTAPEGSSDRSVKVALGSGPVGVVTTTYTDDDRALLTVVDPMPLAGGGGAAAFSVAGSVAVQVSGADLRYAVASPTGQVSVFSRPLAGGAPTGGAVALPAHTAARVAWSGPSLIVTLDDTRWFLIDDLATREARPILLPATGEAGVSGGGDPTRPLLRVDDGTGGATFAAAADGSLSRLFDDFSGPMRPHDIELTPTTLVGGDDRPSSTLPGMRVWQRSVGAAIGPEAMLPARASQFRASAARTAATGRSGMTIFERGEAVKTTTAVDLLDALSGPYLLSTERREEAEDVSSVRLVNGQAISTTRPRAIFGSRVLEQVGAGYQVRDVANPAAPAISVPLTSEVPAGNFTLYGDWLAFEGEPELVRSFNLATRQWGPTKTGTLDALGDGVAFVSGWDDEAQDSLTWAWNLAADTSDVVTTGGDVRATDGSSRVAYLTDTHIVLADVPSMGASAPRVLGVIAPATLNVSVATPAWSFQLDATEPLAAGTLVIEDAAGATVRSLPSPAVADGSVRLSWDGRNDAGTLVAPGAYTYRLEATAASDGKPLAEVDGRPMSKRPLTVSGVIGKMTGATPKVSDTTPRVDQTPPLTAIEGAWTPAAPVFSYQWSKLSPSGAKSVIVGATSKTLTPTGDLAGYRLRVAVTGTADGFTPLTKTSAWTYPVAKATISPATTPVIDDTTPTVDQSLAADLGAWGPAPVTLKYQWYKVNSSGTSYALSGATAAGYQVRPSDVGYRLKVKVTGSKTGYSTRSKTSALTSKVAKATLTSTPTPAVVVDGTPRVGKALTIDLGGAWAPAPVTLSYQWYRTSATGYRSAIYRATKSTYTPTSADLGKTISVRVKGSRSGYVTVYRTSAVTAVVAKGITAATPKISDTTPKAGQELTAIPGTWTAPTGTVSLTYAWYRGSAKVGDGATYTVQAADVGGRLTLRVTGSLDDYVPVTRSSSATYAVVA